jgi:hypothetical protein
MDASDEYGFHGMIPVTEARSHSDRPAATWQSNHHLPFRLFFRHSIPTLDLPDHDLSLSREVL